MSSVHGHVPSRSKRDRRMFPTTAQYDTEPASEEEQYGERRVQ